jgi:hypothetical protein
LRRRQEVALALGAPVRYSVASEGPRARRLGWLRPRRWGRGKRGGRDLQALVYGLEAAIVRPGAAVKQANGAPEEPKGVAVAAIGNAPAAAAILAGLEARLRSSGLSVFLVDLSVSGALVRRMESTRTSSHRADGHAGDGATGNGMPRPASSVFRPAGVPGLARGPRGAAPGALTELPVEDPHWAMWETADVVLALVEVDPGIDIENLASWVGEVVPLVTSGHSTSELLETTADLVRTAGLSLPFAMMIGADESDESLGLVSTAEVEPMAVVSRR